MKKTVLGITTAFIIASTSILGLQLKTNETNHQSLLKLETIEALASGESSNSYNCPGGHKGCVIIKHKIGSTKYYKN